MKARMIHDHPAELAALDISTEDRTASFHFLEPNGDVRLVTIPLRELQRLHQHIVERLAKEPSLFAPAKRDRTEK